eukprot:6445227-Amphidinium_carterae.1
MDITPEAPPAAPCTAPAPASNAAVPAASAAPSAPAATAAAQPPPRQSLQQPQTLPQPKAPTPLLNNEIRFFKTRQTTSKHLSKHTKKMITFFFCCLLSF